MSKRGQITLFIILGIVILAAIGLLIYATYGVKKGEEAERLAEVPLELRPLYNYIGECIKNNIEPGILLLGVQGGYIFSWNSTLEANYSSIAYGYYEGRDVLPSLDFIEGEIDSYLKSTAASCINNSLFPDLEIAAGSMANDIEIKPYSIDIKIDYEITAKKGDSISRVNKFFIKVPVNLGYSYYVAKQIIKKQIEDPDYIDMTFLSGFDADVSIMPHNSSDLVYAVADNRTSEPFTFLFGAKFIVNKAPVLSVPDSFTLKDGVPFLYQVNATDPENDILTFSDDTAMFDITEDGAILFTPEIPGSFNVTITVNDGHQNYDEKAVEFIVEE